MVARQSVELLAGVSAAAEHVCMSDLGLRSHCRNPSRLHCSDRTASSTRWTTRNTAHKMSRFATAHMGLQSTKLPYARRKMQSSPWVEGSDWPKVCVVPGVKARLFVASPIYESFHSQIQTNADSLCLVYNNPNRYSSAHLGNLRSYSEDRIGCPLSRIDYMQWMAL